MAELTTMPIDRVKDVTGGRLRLGPLQQYGVRSVADALNAGTSRLLTIPGVGEGTAPKVVAAAARIAEEVERSIRFRIDLDPQDRLATELLTALWSWGQVRQDLDVGEAAGVVHSDVDGLPARAPVAPVRTAAQDALAGTAEPS